MRYAAVSLDAVGTLFHCPAAGEIYAEVLARHGVAVDADRARTLIRTVWQEMDCRASFGEDRFSTFPGGARGWWARFLERFCEHLGEPDAGPFAAAELYHRFSAGDSWSLYPEVPGVLDELVDSGLRLAVISNFDERLPAVLSGLGVADRFETVVFSQEVAVEKPHPAIFREALTRLGLTAERVVHIGDRRRDDLEGARSAGLEAMHLSRDGNGDLATLAELPEALR